MLWNIGKISINVYIKEHNVYLIMPYINDACISIIYIKEFFNGQGTFPYTIGKIYL